MANYPFKMEPSIYAAFSGPNFHHWKMSVEEYIFDKERDLYLALKGVDYKPNHMSKKDWQLLDKKVLEIIRSGLPQTIASNILHETTTKGAMDALDRLYGTPSASDKMYLMRKLVNMRLSDSELIHNHLNEFDATLSHLSTMDVKFEDEVTALLLLSSLPEGWKDAVMTVSESESVPSKLKYNDVVGAIVNEDPRRRSSRGGTSSSSGIKQEKKQMDRVKPAAYQASVGFVQRVPKHDLPEVAPKAKKKAAEAKSRGDDAFKTKDYHIAVDAYTQAIDLDPTDATLLSNRSLCWMRLGQAEHALADAKACRALRPDWPKACYREGAALRLLQKFDEAANSFYEGVTLDPENKELVNAFREAVEAGRKFHGTNQEKS